MIIKAAVPTSTGLRETTQTMLKNATGQREITLTLSIGIFQNDLPHSDWLLRIVEHTS